jgi:hypothetical protein
VRAAALVGVALALVGCNLQAGGLTATPVPTLGPTRTPVPTATWTPTPTPTVPLTATPSPTLLPTRGPEAYYKRLIVVDQDIQTMFVYQNGALIRRIPVSTGKPDEESTMTPAWEGEVGRYVGTFFAFGTFADDAWYLFEHYGSMLIHSAPYIKQSGRKVYQEVDLLGVRPASHGCIRLPPDESKWFTAWEPHGAHVIIKALTRKF